MKNIKELVLNGTKKYLTYTKIMVTATFIVLAAILCVMCCKKETAPSEQPADLSQKQIEKEPELPVAQPVIEKKSPSSIEGRTYYEDIKENPDFWNQYSAYFEE